MLFVESNPALKYSLPAFCQLTTASLLVPPLSILSIAFAELSKIISLPFTSTLAAKVAFCVPPIVKPNVGVVPVFTLKSPAVLISAPVTLFSGVIKELSEYLNLFPAGIVTLPVTLIPALVVSNFLVP